MRRFCGVFVAHLNVVPRAKEVCKTLLARLGKVLQERQMECERTARRTKHAAPGDGSMVGWCKLTLA